MRGGYFFFADGGQFRSIAISMPLVSIGMVAAILRNYNDFAKLVASKRALPRNGCARVTTSYPRSQR